MTAPYKEEFGLRCARCGRPLGQDSASRTTHGPSSSSVVLMHWRCEREARAELTPMPLIIHAEAER